MNRALTSPYAESREWGVTINGYGISFAGEENVLNLTLVMVVQLCELC